MAKQKFADLPPAQQRAIVIAGALQLTLLAAALFDISRRPADQIKGPKPLWVGISFISVDNARSDASSRRARTTREGIERL